MIPYSPKSRQYLGVMNLTPNSFSDGGELQELSSIKSRMDQWQSHSCIFDWGAVSTAPKNASADGQDALSEWQRLQVMTPLISKLDTICIDTFRPEVLKLALPMAREDQSWIWNDVSGQLDEAAMELLEGHPKMSYILCHNLVPHREATPFHQKYLVNDDDFFYHCLSWFSDRIEFFQNSGLKNPIYIDPCFGFSKNYCHNWELIDRFEEFASTFIDFPLVVGLSRKSFLRERYLSDHPEDQTLDRPELNQKLDCYQEKWHLWFDQVVTQPLFIRLHLPPLG
jgi:dihydropteroate synthase